MPEIHAARRGRAREMIAGAGADAALITSGPTPPAGGVPGR